jgi:hypothetical protein
MSEKQGDYRPNGYSQQHSGRDSVTTQYTNSTNCGNTTDSHNVTNSTNTYHGPVHGVNHYSGVGAGSRYVNTHYAPGATHNVNSGAGNQYNGNAKDLSNMQNNVTGKQTF